MGPGSERAQRLQRQLGDLLDRYAARFGGTRDPEREAACVAQIEEALAETAVDGASLSPLDVVRIRLGKFAATRLSAALYRDPSALTALRGEIHRIAQAYVGDEGGQGSRFG